MPPSVTARPHTEISSKAEVLVLCGALTDVGKPREAEVLAEDLRASSIPLVGVLGNHDYESDQAEDVEKILSLMSFFPMLNVGIARR